MERLTTRCSGYAVMAWEHEEKHTTQEWIDMLTDRLAAYEDTGLEPEEIADFMKRWERAVEIAGLCKKGGIDHLLELKKAEQDGRLHITPEFVWHNGDSGLHKVPYKPWMEKWIATGTKFWSTREEAEAALAGKGDAHEADSV